MKITKLSKRTLGLLILLLGEAGVGKTTQVYSLPEKEVLFLNAEDGIRAIKSWEGDVLDIACWNDFLEISTLIGGVNQNLPFSKAFYDKIIAKYPDIKVEKYKYMYIDSITRISSLCAEYADILHPKDGYAKWGYIADSLKSTFHHLRRADIIVICTGGYVEKTLENGLKEYTYLMDGSAAKDSVKYIFDNVITLVNNNKILPKITNFEKENKGQEDPRREGRTFICRENNPHRFLAKERSEGVLQTYEPANLGDLIIKINGIIGKPDFFNKKKEV